EFDIFDGRPCVALIEAAAFEKDVTPDRSAAAPERECFARSGPMNEAVHQVAVLRKKCRGFRSVIVGADHRIERIILFERSAGALDCFGMNKNVRINEEQEVTFSGSRSKV